MRNPYLSRLTSLASLWVALGCASDDPGEANQEPSAPEQVTQKLDTAEDIEEISEPEQPTNVVYRMAFSDGLPVPGSAVSMEVIPDVSAADMELDASETIPPEPTPKIAWQVQELLDKLQAEGRSDETVSVIVSFRDDFKMPRFPQLDPTQERTAPDNASKLSRSERLVSHIISQRSTVYASREAELLAKHNAQTRDRFWMFDGLLVDLPAQEIAALAARPDVMSIDPTEGGGLTNMSQSRALMSSDPYFNLSLTAGFIGMLDSGVRTNSNHVLLTGRIGLVRDCVNGGTNCTNSADPNWNPWDTLNHGTGVASIMSGTNTLGSTSRGVTAITVDTFKVTATNGSIIFTAVDRAYLRAAALGDSITNGSFDAGTSADSAVAAAADGAFNAGLVVISGAGNLGPGAGTVGCPGNARKVLAVGAIDANASFVNGTRTVLSFSSRGPTADARFKPDLLGPTNVTAASTASTTATQTFGGTSGASPHVTGAAMLWMNWIRQSFPATESGNFYSDLLAMGEQVSFNNTSGAGLPPLLSNGWWTHGKTNVTNGVNIDIPFTVSGSVSRIDAAIWWPESIGGTHDNINLRLVLPSGGVAVSSVSVGGVFEKVGVQTGTLGTWKIRLTGQTVTGTQPVYWSAMVRN